MRVETVSIIYQHPQILLGMKKKRFGRGKYNGFGGKVEEGESLEESAIRETLEESGMIIENPEQMGRILFHFMDGEQDHLVHFFKVIKFNGELKESDEMVSKWFHINEIPYEQMWSDDKYWLPMLLSGKKFIGEFYFDLERKIKNYKLDIVNSF